jgi:hypothetical protein
MLARSAGTKGDTMHRMRRLFVSMGLALAVIAALAPRAGAALLHATDTSQFPDLSGGYVSGTLQYTASTGVLSIQNTPYALALGTSPSSQYDVSATPQNQRTQTIVAQLNPDGSLNPNGTNLYSLYGSVNINGQTYSGLLLKGTPTGFGSLDLGGVSPTSLPGVAMYDMTVKITDGLLKQVFGTDTYIRLEAERGSTFNGSFTQDFSGYKIASNERGYFNVPPAPVPEPTTLVVFIACSGAGLLFRHRRRIAREELESAV